MTDGGAPRFEVQPEAVPAQLPELLVPSAIGLGLEYWLQCHWSPLVNMRTKVRDGSWRSVNFAASVSLGARSVRAASVRRLAVAVHDILERLRDAHESSVAKWQPRDAAWCVYPSRIYQWCLRQ